MAEAPREILQVMWVWVQKPLEFWLGALAEGEETGKNGQQAKRSVAMEMNACLEPLWSAGPSSQAQAYKPVTPGQAALVPKCETRELLHHTLQKEARLQAGIPGRYNVRYRKEGKKS